jgi:acyl dehydratase
MTTVVVGAEVPTLARKIDLVDMVAYAGATWDWHRIHYDPGYLRERGFDAPVVDGQVLGAYLAEQVQDWLGPRSFLRRMRFRFSAMVFAGDTVECHGEVTAVEQTDDGLVVTVAQRVTVGDREAIREAECEVVVAA